MKSLRLLILFSLFQVAAVSAENKTAFVADVAYEYSDNVFNVKNDKQSELEQILGLALISTRVTRLVSLDLDYRFEHSHYFSDNFGDNSRLNGSSMLRISSYPEQYAWVVAQQQDYSVIDSIGADTPNNRTERSTWITGPDFFIKMTPVDFLALSLRYIDTKIDKVDTNDSERYGGNVRWSHLLSDTRELFVQGSYNDVSGSVSAAEYKQYRWGAGLKGRFRKGNYSVLIGETRLERDFTDDSNELYINASLGLNLTRWQVHFSGLREVTDSSLGLSLSDFESNDFSSGDTNFTQAGIVVRSRGQWAVTRQLPGSRFMFNIAAYIDEENYQIIRRDEVTKGFSAAAEYQLTRRYRMGAQFDTEQTDFIDEPQLGLDKDRALQMYFSAAVRGNLQYKIFAKYHDRENSDNPARDYDTWTSNISVMYQYP